ncbi:MAG: PfkB family carbohydrate kinase, partial [Ruthenibacterium sp.]
MKIIWFGSINMDLVYAVPHIAVGGETVMSLSRNVYWGGKGLNQAVALAKSFDGVYMAGFVNENEASVLQYMQENNIDTKYVKFSEKATGHAVIYVDQKGQNSITVYSGSNHDFTQDYVTQVLQDFEKGDIVLLQNEINNLEWVIDAAYAKGMEVALNPSPFDERILRLPLEKIK